MLFATLLLALICLGSSSSSDMTKEEKSLIDLIKNGKAHPKVNDQSPSSLFQSKLQEHRKTKTHEKVVKEKASIGYRNDISLMSRASSNSKHTVVIAVKQKNMDQLEKVLNDVSDPTSSNYGRHWTRDEVVALTKNTESRNTVLSYLRDNGVQVIAETAHGDYVTAETTIKQWEQLLGAQFFEYRMEKATSNLLRASEYTLPQELVEHVTYLFNVVNFPPRGSSSIVKQATEGTANEKTNQMHKKHLRATQSQMTVAQINSYYGVSSNTGYQGTSQAVYESIGQMYSPSDLTSFQTYYNLPIEAVAVDIGGHQSNRACGKANGVDDCAEANLDVQYIMGVAQNVPTTYYYTDDWMVNFVTQVADMQHPPLVISISYGSYEAEYWPSMPGYIPAFDTEAIKLGVMGVTLLASSGDDGVAGFNARGNPLACGYYPSFPATSPYVTAVGGTMGPETGGAEIVCQSQLGGVITSGGGFSYYYGTPSWQSAAVQGYFDTVKGTAKEPQAGFNSFGRGYPDVSLCASSYPVMLGGSIGLLYGTSASSPVMAAFVSLVNSERQQAGKSSVGWLNPSLYSSQVWPAIRQNDITSGQNNCAADNVTCCSQSFWAAPGWDPATGLGSVNLDAFKSVYSQLGNSLPQTPSAPPTPSGGSPTVNPNQAPTLYPSLAPTAQPTALAGWISIWQYDSLSCAGSENVDTAIGLPTGTCFAVYDATSTVAAGWVKYACGDIYATESYYSDAACTSDSYLGDTQLFLGCALSFDTSNTYFNTKGSSLLQCTSGGATPLPATTTGFSAVGQYDGVPNKDDPDCTMLSSFIAISNTYCDMIIFPNFNSSVQYAYPNVKYWPNLFCEGQFLTYPLVTECKATSAFPVYGATEKARPDYTYAAADDDYYGDDDFIGSAVALRWMDAADIQHPRDTPTAMPTFFGEYETTDVTMLVTQRLVGISAATYQAAMQANNAVMAAAVSDVITDVNAGQVTVVTVSASFTSRRRVLTTEGMDEDQSTLRRRAQTIADSCYVYYKVVFSAVVKTASADEQGTTMADIYFSELQASINDGSFDSALHTAAINQRVPDMAAVASGTATLDSVQVGSDSASGSSNHALHAGGIAGIVIACIALCACCGGVAWFAHSKSSSSSVFEPSRDVTVVVEPEPLPVANPMLQGTVVESTSEVPVDPSAPPSTSLSVPGPSDDVTTSAETDTESSPMQQGTVLYVVDGLAEVQSDPSAPTSDENMADA